MYGSAPAASARALLLRLFAFRFRFFVAHRYMVTLGRPCAEVDQATTLRAEWAEFARRVPRHRLAALRGSDGACIHVYRLQNVSSNSTSDSTIFGRCAPSCVVKRMFNAYLFALISGTQ